MGCGILLALMSLPLKIQVIESISINGASLMAMALPDSVEDELRQ